MSRIRSDVGGGRTAVRGGALLGAVYFGLVFHWVPVALVVADPGLGSVGFAVAAFVLIVVGLAAMTAVAIRLLHHAVHGLGAPLWLALAVTWTALEWSRAHLPDSLALPWLGLGTSLTAYPELVGIAEIVGARGVTFWLAAVNGLLATLWLRRGGTGEGSGSVDGGSSGTGRAALAAATAVVVGAPAAWGVWRASALEIRPVADVAVVQPNVEGRAKVPAEPMELRDPTERLPSPDDVLVDPAADGVDAADGGSPDLIVLPELFVRAVPGSPEASGAVDALRTYSERVGAPMLFGGLGADGSVRYNSAFVVTPAGLEDFRYDKHRLVPVVERVPFLSPSRRHGTGSTGAYGEGTGWPLAEIEGVRYGVLICYESSYAESARALRRAGADVLVNLTNDAWFGAEPWYARTTALWQHPAHLVMRAIEGRVGVVRSANTGISFFVDPVGRRYEVSELFTADVRRDRVRSTDVSTVYVRFGDVVGTASALVAFGLLLLVARPTRTE